MSDIDPHQLLPPTKENWPAPSWKKVGEFVTGIFQLQRSVERLQKQNDALQSEVARLQRITDDHSGQLKTIMALIESTVNERAAQRAETAAMRMVQQLLALRDDAPANEE